MALKVAFQMDPIERIDIRGDSTFALLLEAQWRGHDVFYYTPDNLSLKDGKLMEHWDSDSNQASDSAGSMTLAAGNTEPNRAQVLAFIDKVLVGGDHAAMNQLLGAGFVEHRASSGSGAGAFLDYVTKDSISYTKVHHVIADGNFVFTLSEGKLGSKSYGFYDLFRLEAGAIVEHWDSRRSVPASTASGLPTRDSTARGAEAARNEITRSRRNPATMRACRRSSSSSSPPE